MNEEIKQNKRKENENVDKKREKWRLEAEENMIR